MTTRGSRTLRLAAIALATSVLAACSASPASRRSPSRALERTGLSPSSAGSIPTPEAAASIDLSTLGGRIVFSNDIEDIWRVNADGSGLQQLTTHAAHDFDPAWSADGARIAFRSERDGNNEIYVMNADGSSQQRLSSHPAEDWGPTWSPDGRVLWNCANGRSFGLGACLANPSSKGYREIPVDVFFEYPSWSPDGKRIAFMSMEPGAHGTDPEYNVYVMNADGSGLRRLTDSAGQDGFPSWSPDGSKIAFSSTRDDCSNSTADDCRSSGDIGPFHTLYVMNADGSDQRRVTEKFAQFVDWSPDGRYLVFSPGLNIIRPDGSGLTALPVSVGGAVFPDWNE